MTEKKLYWAYLLHLGYNLWLEEDSPKKSPYNGATSKLRFEEDAYEKIVDALCDAGVNMLVIDLGEGVQYKSHPEIAVEGAWSVEKLKSELDKLRARGITPIPKLNFATTHDEWMGVYARMVSSPKYYEVCSDLIKEVCEIFDSPEYFHIGMDEEKPDNHCNHLYCVVRQYDLWWHDLNFFIEECRKNGATAIMWSDMGLHKPEFAERVPKHVIQNNWYYWNYWADVDADYINKGVPEYAPDEIESYYGKCIELFHTLEKAGLKQMPAGSSFYCDWNFENLVKFSRKVISDENLVGFMNTVWRPTSNEMLPVHYKAISQMKSAIKDFK